MTKRELRDEIATTARRYATNPERYAQSAACVLLSLAGALSGDSEEALMECCAKFSQAEIVRLSANYN